ncbi:hypothetical protein NPIL_409711 [Nephila pilipes]|uniref:Uncharacterized protein n=1 Tax=Nephila pilipes TaxID=299642 RepID=A0A8X6TQ31_NEPPI|nr:hypothetical protein NPIL_409711 [Nephila pilipes]
MLAISAFQSDLDSYDARSLPSSRRLYLVLIDIRLQRALTSKWQIAFIKWPGNSKSLSVDRHRQIVVRASRSYLLLRESIISLRAILNYPLFFFCKVKTLVVFRNNDRSRLIKSEAHLRNIFLR